MKLLLSFFSLVLPFVEAETSAAWAARPEVTNTSPPKKKTPRAFAKACGRVQVFYVVGRKNFI
jgi:hypothetical protein